MAAENNVLITMIAHTTDGNEKDTTETIYPGKGYEKDGCYYVFYDEVDPEDAKVTKASLRIRPRHIDIRKKGAVNTQMVLFPASVPRRSTRHPTENSFSPWIRSGLRSEKEKKRSTWSWITGSLWAALRRSEIK